MPSFAIQGQLGKFHATTERKEIVDRAANLFFSHLFSKVNQMFKPSQNLGVGSEVKWTLGIIVFPSSFYGEKIKVERL